MKHKHLVIFSHGKESGPQGTKIKLLSEVAEDLGFSTISIDYTKCEHVNERVELLRGTLKEHNDAAKVLVGSSMGGYVSTVVGSEFEIEGLFLMCPALYMENYPIQSYAPLTDKVEIVHGWNDEIVPFENSIQFGKELNARLHLVKDKHRLSHSHHFLKHTFKAMLDDIKYTTAQVRKGISF